MSVNSEENLDFLNNLLNGIQLFSGWLTNASFAVLGFFLTILVQIQLRSTLDFQEKIWATYSILFLFGAISSGFFLKSTTFLDPKKISKFKNKDLPRKDENLIDRLKRSEGRVGGLKASLNPELKVVLNEIRKEIHSLMPYVEVLDQVADTLDEIQELKRLMEDQLIFFASGAVSILFFMLRFLLEINLENLLPKHQLILLSAIYLPILLYFFLRFSIKSIFAFPRTQKTIQVKLWEILQKNIGSEKT
ncbi:MAG: hypothetical protein ACOYM4_00860 [Nodosilinea sp.]